MIFVRGRDDSKGLELGLGFDSDAEMDEPEVEEGEACSYQDFEDDYDPTIDLDVALSYIDEKLQDVLGHFQKDFEGLVTAENLGAKFGDYGSFLPTYQRATAWSHLKIPVKTDNHNQTFLRKSNPEDGLHVLRRHEEDLVRNVAKRTEEILSANCMDVSSSRIELEKNHQSSDQRIMKACTEMGSDNLPTHKIAKIYSGLGLELSPSSSLEESPVDIESLNESPSRILQIMTSFPVPETLLLSPLTDVLINLTLKHKKLQKEGKPRVSKKASRAHANVPDPLNNGEKKFNDKKSMSIQKGISSLHQKNLNVAVLKKETVSDTLACEKLVNAISKDTANGENFDINVRLKENNELKEAKGAFSFEAQSDVSIGIKAQKAEIFQEKNDMQLHLDNEHSSFGKQKKVKGTQNQNERDCSVPKKEMENPKANEISAKAVYKDLFGEMELDNELDTEKEYSIDRGKDDIASDKSRSAPKSATEKNINTKNTKSASSAAPISHLVASSQGFKELDKKDSANETNIHVSQGDQSAVNNKSLNGLSHSSLASQLNFSEKQMHTEAENDRLFERLSNGGQNSKRPPGQNGYRVSKKIRVDGLYSCEEDGKREKDELCQANGSHQIKSSKKSLLRAKEENGIFKSEIDKGKTKIYESPNESMDYMESNDQTKNVKSSNIETKLAAKKDSIFQGSKENIRSESLTVSGENNLSGVKFDPAPTHDQKQKILNNVDEKSLEKQQVSEKVNSHSLPPSGRGRNETGTHSRSLNRGDYKENGVNNSSMDISEGDNALETSKQKLSQKNNRINLRQPTANGLRPGDKDVPSVGKRDSSSHVVSNVLKEAKDLKHLADRLKNAGSSAETTGYYFQAALKFLHGASLLESSSGESAKQSEAIQSMQIYSSTGKLCGFCAHEYEKSKDMATASLAYKCMEVAYMRVIYSSRVKASRDRLELTSQIGVPGESPLSSASDVDNLNNPKSDKTKAIVSSPQVASLSNNIISAGDRPCFIRLLNYAQDVNYAMEASRKCKIAFTAASQRMEETKYKEEGIASIKRALDFNFQDVEGLLRFFSCLLLCFLSHVNILRLFTFFSQLPCYMQDTNAFANPSR